MVIIIDLVLNHKPKLIMRYFILVTFTLFSFICSAQSLPIDFESSVTTADFIDFDGGTASVIANPQNNSGNTSAKVAQIVRDGGQLWSGSKIELSNNLDFTTDNSITMKVYSTAPAGTVVKMKLEGAGETERDVVTTLSGSWETLRWDFTGTAGTMNNIVFMFDFGNIGDGSANSTFLFDDVQQVFGGTQIDLPVDFEGLTVNHTMSDFGGNISSLVVDPTNSINRVIQVIKPVEAAAWAGTTIGTPAGFLTDIPLTLTESVMKVNVWSPDAGIPVRLKVEDSDDPTHTCETQTNTTVTGGWETIEFDFTNQAQGTESLEVGLSKGWTYNMASIFFNFDTDGATAGKKTYYFDNVVFGDVVIDLDLFTAIEGLSVYPNPSNAQWTVTSDNALITQIEVFNIEGKLLRTLTVNNTNTTIDATDLIDGLYYARVQTEAGNTVLKLLK